MNKKTLKVLEYNKVIEIVANFAYSDMGKEKILSLVPMSDIEEIEEALRETSEAVSIILQKGRIPLDGFQDINNALRKARIGSILTPGDLLKIAQVLKVTERVKDYIREEGKHEHSCPIIKGLTELLVELPGLTKDIFNIVVSDDEICDHASPELFKIRKQINQKHNAIRDKLSHIVGSVHYQKYLQENIITIRGDRYVIPVKQEYRGNIQGLIHDQSSSGATLFIEPMSVVEMNNELKTLKIKEEQEIERILANYTIIVGNNYDAIYKNYQVLIKLDVIFAKGNYSIENHATKPKLNDQGYINLRRARHPLIPKNEVVASDIYLGKDFDTLVITGPNTGGKTVTLKTIGLLCLMALAGFHIPVEEHSEVAVYNNIYADIGDEQSIEQSLSTFSSHMKNIIDILEKADDNSLVLFDELGAGTDPTEGVALAMAILDYLRMKGIKTVATTHYSELKEYALSMDRVENASVEFDVGTLKPTYKLLIGIPGKSNAFEISKRLGLSDSIIASAKKYVSLEDIRFEDILIDIDKKRKQIEENQLAAHSARLDAEILLKNVREKEAKLEVEKDRILTKAKEEALSIIKDAKRQAEGVIDELKRIEMEESHERNRRIELNRGKLKGYQEKLEVDLSISTMPRNSFSPPKELRPGDPVHIVTLNQKGYVLSAPNDKQEVQVQAGIMKINVHISNLSKIQEDEDPMKDQLKRYSKCINKSIDINAQLDLRGKLADESVLLTDKYLDDAYLANLKTVTIIHGKGAGILRKNIHNLLKKHIHVKEYRIGNFNEGGDGVTIVTLK